MTLSDPLVASLKAVAAVMDGARNPWWVIGSAAVALHGADAGPVADVDVLLSIDEAERLLPALGIAVRRGSAHPDFRSRIFGHWTGAPLPIEFMAGFCHRSGAVWREVWLATREPIGIDDVTVFVPGLTELRRLLKDFGRPKDLARAAALRPTD